MISKISCLRTATSKRLARSKQSLLCGLAPRKASTSIPSRRHSGNDCRSGDEERTREDGQEQKAQSCLESPINLKPDFKGPDARSTKSGWLHKHWSGALFSTRRRWFVLAADGSLSYAETEKAMQKHPCWKLSQREANRMQTS